ncbi:antibiotic biosynthesis monooxygenase [Reyranella sp.]|uniref:antibiotic biosynthesis monooxygenase n=1 Tax=Reyranella sp. TaxID=1929291 RepID=UPI003BA9479F
MAQPETMNDTPVALVVQHRVAESGYADYTRWLAGLKERLRRQPGFVAEEVIPPVPPAQPEWILVARFANARAAHDWLDSPDRAAALAEIRRKHLVADEEVHVMTDRSPARQGGASAFLAYTVPTGKEAAFQAWQEAIHAEEIRQPGYLRRKIEPPAPGGNEWIIVLTFDTDANLSAWLSSAERQAMLNKGRPLALAPRLSRTSYGFDFWFRGDEASRPAAGTILKNNLLVLLVLNPIVFLWGLGPGSALAAHGVPPWLGLFIGDLVSTQLLGWWFAPAAFRVFGWWLAPAAGWRTTLAGGALLAALFALSMAVHAALLRLIG